MGSRASLNGATDAHPRFNIWLEQSRDVSTGQQVAAQIHRQKLQLRLHILVARHAQPSSSPPALKMRLAIAAKVLTRHHQRMVFLQPH